MEIVVEQNTSARTKFVTSRLLLLVALNSDALQVELVILLFGKIVDLQNFEVRSEIECC